MDNFRPTPMIRSFWSLPGSLGKNRQSVFRYWWLGEAGRASQFITAQKHRCALSSVVALFFMSLLEWNESEKISQYYYCYYYVPFSALRSYTTALSDDFFVCYLFHALSPRWSSFPGNPEHPCPPIFPITEELLLSVSFIAVFKMEKNGKWVGLNGGRRG